MNLEKEFISLFPDYVQFEQQSKLKNNQFEKDIARKDSLQDDNNVFNLDELIVKKYCSNNLIKNLQIQRLIKLLQIPSQSRTEQDLLRIHQII